MSSKKIGLGLATLTAMNAMIGAGIFSTPIKLIASVGPAGILTYLFVVIAIWCMAFSFARLAQFFPQAGSFYTYAGYWGGQTAGLISSGSYLIGIVIAMGLLTQLAGIYLHDYLPVISAYALGLAVLICLVCITVLGGTVARAAQIISIVCTAVPLSLITLLCLTKASMAHMRPFAPYGFAPIFRATQTVIFGFFGFESTASLFAIVESPQRTVPRALTYAIIMVSAIYFLFIISIMLATPHHFVAEQTMPISHLLRFLFPAQTWLITILHFSITASFITVLNAMLFATSSLLTSLVKATRENSSSLKPHTATILMGILIAASYSLLNNMDLFFDFTALFIILAFIMALISLFYFKQTKLQLAQTIIGLGAAGTIFYFAVEGIVKNLFLSR